MNLRHVTRSEDTEQINVITWANWKKEEYPELELLHHCPNGGRRNKQEAVKLKRMGTLAGVADLHLPVPKGVYCGLYIEMKYGDGRIETSQKEFLKKAARYGNYCVVCYGAEEAIKILQEYVKLKPYDVESQEDTMKYQNLTIHRKGKIKEIK